jgi:hypothetical protein
MGEPPSLRFVFEILERIEINLLEEKAAWVSSSARRSHLKRLR